MYNILNFIRRKDTCSMKNNLLKVIALICCVTICLGVFVSCGKKKQPDLATPAASTTTRTPTENEPLATFRAPSQEADDDECILIEYDIPTSLADDYDSFEARVYHDDEHNNLLYANVLNPNSKVAAIKSSYGKLRVELVGISEGEDDTLLATEKPSVWAKEYNFASLNATFPVVYFTLELFSMDGESKANFEAANEGGKNIQFIKNVPTFVSLERAAAYDWDNLPSKVHPMPNATYEDSTTGEFHKMNAAMAEYIKELHEINPDSKFNFYCVDNYPELILKLFTAQGIDDDHFTATMISDGTASVSAFKYLFADGETAESIYNETKATWESAKAKAASGDPTYLDDIPYAPNPTYSVLWRYALTIANESSNVQWWCSRDNFTAATTSDFMKNILAEMNGTKIQYFGVNDLLSKLSEEDQVALKGLFHFDGEMFAASEAAGKKSLVIIGTNWEHEGNIEGYIKLLQAEHGDEYVIYYKGHPRYPTGLNQEKIDIFEEYGVIDIDATLAAELILFYCPDIYLAGFPSTTFKSALDGKFIAMFDKTKVEGLGIAQTDGYGDEPSTFYTTVTVGEASFVVIENSDDDTVRYFNVTSGEFVAELPTV